MGGPLAHQPQGFDFGSTTTPVIDQGFNPPIITHIPVQQQQWNAVPRVPTSDHPQKNFGASLLFNPMGSTDSAGVMDFVQQGYLSSAAGNNQRVVPSFGTEEVGGE